MRELWEARELLWSFAIRELSVRYKQSFLGVLWAIIQPLSAMLVFTIFFAKLAKMPSSGVPYPVFSYTALLPWGLFSGSLTQAIPSLATNADLINKVYFPRVVLPLSSILVAGADFLVASVLGIGLMLWYHVHVTLAVFYLIPLLLIHLVFTAGICLVFSGLNVFYRDIRYALPLVLQLWIYVVPVIYPIEIVPAKWRTLYMLDPMAVAVDGFRRCLVLGQAPLWTDMALAFGSASVILLLGVTYFRWVEGAFADIV